MFGDCTSLGALARLLCGTTKQQIREAAAATDSRLGDALVAAHGLTPEQLADLLLAQSTLRGRRGKARDLGRVVSALSAATDRQARMLGAMARELRGSDHG